ncbi:hypothetical protein [Microbacterium sp. NIBRBAC000506063]|uniref:hypothetical protein n=1 Tax=Microbacterium sp. NIBRBAC000506063 TaxID=2734618 RepID=UPI001BB6EE87|nr:hypothetical protein [Microbacterium sp. NIBRBAC000506063]QTV80989.1 hypothetical protein KAE78_14880 [Microbacterium sp. NIBRBAC000506063]
MTGLPRAVLLTSVAELVEAFFRELPGDGRISAASAILRGACGIRSSPHPIPGLSPPDLRKVARFTDIFACFVRETGGCP